MSNELKLIEITSTCRTFQLGEHPELIHVIETGFNNLYMVVHEDAYELNLGKVEYGTKKEIEDKFSIDLTVEKSFKEDFYAAGELMNISVNDLQRLMLVIKEHKLV